MEEAWGSGGALREEVVRRVDEGAAPGEHLAGGAAAAADRVAVVAALELAGQLELEAPLDEVQPQIDAIEEPFGLRVGGDERRLLPAEEAGPILGAGLEHLLQELRVPVQVVGTREVDP